MRRLNEVEDAKALMTEAMDWSVLRWLFEKRRVRETADLANAALDRLDKKIKTQWTDELKTAYRELGVKSGGSAMRKNKPTSPGGADEVKVLAKRLKDADEKAYLARTDAEETFDEAERQLSTSLAREGCRKAIHSWKLHEQAIRKSEAVLGATKAQT